MIPQDTALLETDILRTFVAIAENGSFTSAARQINRTPSAVSMQIKKLEEQLGRPVFRREGRSVSLTPDGEALLGYGRRLIALNREAISRFRVPELEGRVRFGAPDDFGTRFLPSILCRFAQTHPQVEVDVILGPSLQLIEQHEKGDIDVIIVTASPTPKLGAAARIIHVEQLAWVGLKDGTAAMRDPIPLALSGAGCAWRGQALAALDQAGIDYRVAYTCENCQGQIAAMLADLAIAPLPVSLIGHPHVRVPDAIGLPPIGNYQIEKRVSPNASAAALAFCAHVEDAFGALTGAD